MGRRPNYKLNISQFNLGDSVKVNSISQPCSGFVVSILHDIIDLDFFYDIGESIYPNTLKRPVKLYQDAAEEHVSLCKVLLVEKVIVPSSEESA